MRLPDRVRRLFRLGGVLPRSDRDVDDEIRHHFDEVVRAYVREGVDEEDAAQRAHERFGDERAYRLALTRIDDRRVRMRERSERMDSWMRTLTQSLRSLRRAPWFTLAVVSILALGIGANSVMFGVVDRLLLSPPQHIVDADAVKILHVRRAYNNGDIHVERTLTYPDFMDFQSVGAFSGTAGYAESQEVTVGRGESAAQARASGASASLFPLLGVQPAAGRFFSEEEDAIGATPTAVLAHEYWERAYGGDPSVLGTTIDVAHGTYTIIGVAPPGFTGAVLDPTDIWLPLRTAETIESGDEWVDSRGWYWIHGVVRLAPGVTVEAAEAEATAAHRSGRAEFIAEGRYDAGAEILVGSVIAAQGPRPSAESQVARWLAGVSVIVLLIACFNVANLLLARAVHTRKEIAVRLALGVGRARLIGEVVVEGLILAALGAGAALLLARFLGGALHQTLLPNVAFTDTGLSVRLLAFTLVATLLTACLTSIVPALHATRTNMADALRSGGRDGSAARSRTRVALLVGQAALSVVLLVGAGLFVRSLRQAQGLDLGFDADRIVVASLEWNETLPGDERLAIYRDVLTRVRRLPGVRAAGLTYTVPFRSSISIGQPLVPGLDSIPRHHNGGPYANKVGSGYFEAMGLTILQGRGIEPIDDAEGAQPITVVSASMAQAIWPAGDAIGACILVGGEEDAPCTEVVGIVENHRRQALVEDDPHFLYYLNQGHPEFQGPPQAMMVGSTGDPRQVLSAVRAEARNASSQVRFVNAVAMSDYVAPELRSWTLGASMFSLFGLLALVVAAWGLYSVLAFDVALRGHELGVRSALGAGTKRIVRLVLRQALTLVGAGTVLGLVIAASAARFIQPLLFRVPAVDPWTYAAVAATLLLVAAIAGSLPAWRATRVDPTEALRAD